MCKKKFYRLLVVFVLTAVCLAGGSFTQEAEAAEYKMPKCGTVEVPNNPDAIVVRVGTMGTYSPYNYVDESGDLQGWDIEVMKEIDRREPGVKFEYAWGAWDTLFPGLDADKFDVLSTQLGWTKERDEMYAVCHNPYSTNANKLLIHPDNKDKIKSIDDVYGHGYTLGGTVGNYYTMMMEKFLEEHPGGFKIQYYEGDSNSVFQDVASKRIDGTLEDPAIAKSRCEIIGIADLVVATGDSLWRSGQFMIAQDTEKGRKIAAIIDKHIGDFYEDHFLEKLRGEIMGEQFVEDVVNMAQWKNEEEREQLVPADKR
jgi:L-cystine transport system substrate-binding protein